MKKILSALIAFCLLLCAGTTVCAADTGRSYDFDLTVNGEHEVTALPGDVLTVTLTLHRTDSSDPAEIYALQDEIRYDDEFLEIVEGGILTPEGINTTNIVLLDGDRAFYMNFLSMSGGESWNAETIVGTFQIRVLSESGATVLKNENILVPLQDGSDTYAVTAGDLKIVVTAECTVKFDPMNGQAVWEQSAVMGELLTEPETPAWEGYTFTGWYTDMELTHPWDFNNHRVESNMTLYAGWEKIAEPASDGSSGGGTAGRWLLPVCIGLGAALVILLLLLLLLRRKKVEFVTPGGTAIQTVRVRKGSRLETPPIPRLEGKEFVGWYRDEACLKRWDFENDTVEENTTIYAKWR